MKKRFLTLLSCLLVLCTLLSSCTFYAGLPGGNGNDEDEIKASSVIADLLEKYSYYDFSLTDEELSRLIVNAYKEKTEDLYAHYYNAEEYAALTEENRGDSKGIGVMVTENTEFNCIEIVAVLPDTPAMKAGLKAGDLIVQVGLGENAETVSDLGFEIALNKMAGDIGGACEFGVVRNRDFSKILEFSVIREEFVTTSVMYAVSTADTSVGIVKILQFDLTTPVQFEAAMEELIKQGCTAFIYDVRNNPGGDLLSIAAVLSYFLNENDTVVITEDRDGNTETITCKSEKYTGDYATCSIVKAKIGLYRDYPAAVLINGYTASAAELFTGSLKSYELATIVGETTFGKGCMQSIIPLSYYGEGLTGAIKMTSQYYRPYGMENYHGIGITPTEGYDIVISEEAANINIYSLLESENQAKDNQLAKAIEAINAIKESKE